MHVHTTYRQERRLQLTWLGHVALIKRNSDHLGTGTMTMSYGGDLLSCEFYTPFGETSYTTRPRNRHRYCGKEKDSESGLYYYGARYYESWTCRFVSVDPLAEKYAQLSSYNYADNSPVTDLDVDGLQSTRSQQSPQSNAAQDNTSTQSPVKPKIVPTVKVTGTIQKPQGKIEAKSDATSTTPNNIKHKVPANNLPAAIKGLRQVNGPRIDPGKIRPMMTKEETRVELARRSAWAWGPFAAIGGGLLAAPLGSLGSVGSGTATTMAIKGSVNVASQALEKNGKLGEIDVFDVAVAMAPGVKGLSPRQATLLLNSASAFLDVKANGQVNSLGNGKSMSEVALDAGAGLVGNKAGSSVAKGPVAQGLNQPIIESLVGEQVSSGIKATFR